MTVIVRNTFHPPKGDRARFSQAWFRYEMDLINQNMEREGYTNIKRFFKYINKRGALAARAPDGIRGIAVFFIREANGDSPVSPQPPFYFESYDAAVGAAYNFTNV